MECPLFFMFLTVCACICVYACKFMFVRSPLLSSSFRMECVSVCVFLHSPQGLFQLRAKNTEKL